MASIEVIEGADVGHAFSLNDEVTLGRSPEGLPPSKSFIPLSDGKVSRRHARISRRGETFYVEDLGSTNGTFLRGERMQRGIAYPLREGDELRICATRLVFHTWETAPTERREIPEDLARKTLHRAVQTEDCLAPDRPTLKLKIVKDDSSPPGFAAVMEAAAGAVATGQGERGLQDAVKRLKAMSQVSVALGAITDREKLMRKVMDCVFEIFLAAERSFILLRERGGDALVPVAARKREEVWGHQEELVISRTIVNEVMTRKRAILSFDALGDERFKDRTSSIINLAIRSMICAPLLLGDEILGLIQVDTSAGAKMFNSLDLEILSGISTQVAIALKNAELYADIERLFDAFVRASVQAIEARDPTTAGHSFRVSELAERLARALGQADRFGLSAFPFNDEQLRAIRYAALLHDFGKIGVREHLLTKCEKLYPQQMELVELRFKYARAALEREAYRQLVEQQVQRGLSGGELATLRAEIESGMAAEVARLQRYLDTVRSANRLDPSGEQTAPDLRALAEYTFPGEGQEQAALLDELELDCLAVVKGTLSPEERVQMESHVDHTYAFLRLIPWTKPLAAVPDIAYAHHERLDGTGYPRGLEADAIPLQSRILAIADIYDALTSGDRPYHPRLPVDQALDVLRAEAGAGRIDADLVRVFIESKAYEPMDSQ
jgi:HD-GYP domain-containing protein (c-di-GMP phosphodiesterase class II)